ncbi:MAG: DUF3551 domain-containing protein [Rhizobiales bacterium]|nr:DUF3551 domain-containing protein [Hyphomicrobiales bacterium]
MIGAIAAASPATAQTYDPDYPVCLHVFGGFTGGGEYYECRYTSMTQCRASAAGRAAMCDINPYFAPAGKNTRRQKPGPGYPRP